MLYKIIKKIFLLSIIICFAIVIKENVQISFYNIDFVINPILLCFFLYITFFSLNFSMRFFCMRKSSGSRLYSFFSDINNYDIHELKDKMCKIDITPIFFFKSDANSFKDAIFINALLCNSKYDEALQCFCNNQYLFYNKKWNRVIINSFSRLFDSYKQYIYSNSVTNITKSNLHDLIKLYKNDFQFIGYEMYIHVCILNSDFEMLLNCVFFMLKKKTYNSANILFFGICFFVDNANMHVYCDEYNLKLIDKSLKILDFLDITENIYSKVVFLVTKKIFFLSKIGESNKKIKDFVSTQFSSLKNFKILEGFSDLFDEDYFLKFDEFDENKELEFKYMAINHLDKLRDIKFQDIYTNDTKSFLCYINSIIEVKSFSKLSDIFSRIHTSLSRVCVMQYDEWFCIKCLSYKERYLCICHDCGYADSIVTKMRNI